MRTPLACIFIGFLLVAPGTVSAQKTGHDPNKWSDFLQSKHKQNLTGWDRIVFFCSAGNSELGKDICQKANTNFDFLIAASKIEATRVDTAFKLGFQIGLGHLPLELVINATNDEGAAVVRLYSYASYSQAIEKGKSSGPIAKPRYGELVVWESSSIGYGGTFNELSTVLAESADQMLKRFLTDYLNAQK